MLLLAVLVTIGPSAFNKFGFGFRLYTDYGGICCATLGSRKTPDVAFSAYQFVCGRSHSCTASEPWSGVREKSSGSKCI